MLPEHPSRRVPRAMIGLTVLAYAGLLLRVANAPDAALAVALEVLLSLPGMLLVRAAAGPAAGWLPIVTFGPLLGFALSSLSMVGFWIAGGRGLWLFVAAPATLLALVPFASRARGRWPFPLTQRSDAGWLAAILLIVPIVTAAPFAHVGADLEGSKAYRAYFTADYVWRRAVVAELAKGSVLPQNPFYRDDPLHYYWLPHLASSVSYRNGHIDLDGALLTNSVLKDAAFVAFLYGLARWFVGAPWAAAAGVAVAITATSFEGLYAILDHWLNGAPLTLLRYLNIDALSRWVLHSLPIDGLQRVLFYQPHHALGYAVGFMGVLAVTTRLRRFDPLAMTVGGVLLGLCTMVSSFAGLMLTTVAAVWEAGSVLRWKEWWRATVHASAAALPLVLAAALITALQYVDTGGSIITFGPNPVAFRSVIPATLLSFGPMVPIALVSGAVLWLRRDERGWVFATLWVTCAVYYFFVDIRDHQDVYVGWRVGHLWFIASVALAAIVFNWIAEQRAQVGRAAAAVTVLLVMAALPTTLIDIYNTQDIYNWGQGPGFSWTLLLSPEEQEMFAWIRTHTPPSAVFQTDPVARDVQGWAYLPAFAERRMAVGLPISMVPLHKYEQGSRRAAWMYETSSAADAHDIARRNEIDYLVIGAPERAAHPAAQARFDAASAYFLPVFRNREATIYMVR